MSLMSMSASVISQVFELAGSLIGGELVYRLIVMSMTPGKNANFSDLCNWVS